MVCEAARLFQACAVTRTLIMLSHSDTGEIAAAMAAPPRVERRVASVHRVPPFAGIALFLAGAHLKGGFPRHRTGARSARYRHMAHHRP
eukprot:4674958-Prymnesium_polylepis.2